MPLLSAEVMSLGGNDHLSRSCLSDMFSDACLPCLDTVGLLKRSRDGASVFGFGGAGAISAVLAETRCGGSGSTDTEGKPSTVCVRGRLLLIETVAGFSGGLDI